MCDVNELTSEDGCSVNVSAGPYCISDGGVHSSSGFKGNRQNTEKN